MCFETPNIFHNINYLSNLKKKFKKFSAFFMGTFEKKKSFESGFNCNLSYFFNIFKLLNLLNISKSLELSNSTKKYC